MLGCLGLQPRDARCSRNARADLHGRLFRVLPADAVVHAHRQDQAGADEGHLPCALSSSPSRLRCSPVALARGRRRCATSTRPTSTWATARRCSAARRTSSTTASAATRPSTSATTAWRHDLGITEQQLIENLMFTGERPFDTMRIAMQPGRRDALVRRRAARPVADRAQPRHGLHLHVPALVLRRPGRPTGVNNLVLPGTAMPHVLWELQGVQEAVCEGHVDAAGKSSGSSRNSNW